MGVVTWARAEGKRVRFVNKEGYNSNSGMV